MSDFEVLLFAYTRYSQANGEDPRTIARVRRDYQAWLNGDIAPNYACSELRQALKDRDHRLVSVALLETYIIPLAA